MFAHCCHGERNPLPPCFHKPKPASHPKSQSQSQPCLLLGVAEVRWARSVEEEQSRGMNYIERPPTQRDSSYHTTVYRYSGRYFLASSPLERRTDETQEFDGNESPCAIPTSASFLSRLSPLSPVILLSYSASGPQS